MFQRLGAKMKIVTHRFGRPLRIESLERRQLLAAEIIDLRPAASDDGVWQHLSVREPVVLGPLQANQPLALSESYLRAHQYETFAIDHDRLATELQAARPILTVPTPDGGFDRFELFETQVMAPELAAKFPEIQTWGGTGIGTSATIRLDVSPAGFFAQVRSVDGDDYYIDPYYHLEDQFYASYFEKGEFDVPEDYDLHGDVEHTDAEDAHAEDAHAEDGDDEHREAERRRRAPTSETSTASVAARGEGESTAEAQSGSVLRTYRTAVAATGEYTTFHGGTVASAQAAIVTAINRVSGIYEDELSIRLQLVANNDQLVYTDSTSDPYSNTVGGAALNANQSNIDAVIGVANYDIGHLLVTDGGGLAGLGVVGRSGVKAHGVSGSFNTGNDRFFVNILSHEIGHQFDGEHTFNGDSSSCSGNRAAGAAYEPGSGSTIQAYAGICGNDNLQNDSDAHFHSFSMEQMVAYVDNVIPNVGTRTNTNNNIPTVDAGLDYIIPAQTPFVLTASGQDADANDLLTYSWEQRDLGPQQDVSAGDNGSSPLFRVFEPTIDPARTFPRLSDLVDNTTVRGETLPTTNRELNFVVTVRDDSENGAAFNSDAMLIDVVDTGAPFQVTSPDTSVSLPALSEQTVTWDVAGTTGNGINTPHVNILLSTDGGNTFPFTLASRVRNDGAQPIVLPLALTSNARVKVEADGNIFFDISDADFTIAAPAFPSDFGDAPNLDYPTLSVDGGAQHTDAGSDIFLGTSVDREADGQDSNDATGDGIDEDGIVIDSPLVAGTTGEILVTASGAGVLDFFFDFDGTAGWGNNANEVFRQTVVTGTQAISVPVPVGAVNQTFARFRLSLDGDLGPAGIASGGEVEDYAIEIFDQAPAIDFADAAESYHTLLIDDGPRHLVRGPTLGESVDGDPDGLPNATATGDGRDDDGITFTELLIRDTTVNVDVLSSAGGGELDYFFDFDGDGTFGNRPNEIFQATLTGLKETVPVVIPATATTGITKARFRISSNGGLLDTGSASDGEVEDYQVVIIAPGQVGTPLENFDDVITPALPAGWTAETDGWFTSDTQSDSQPNHAFHQALAFRDDSLESPVFVAAQSRLRFRNSYDIDLGFHGAVLEISINAGSFQDILAAGGTFVAGGYTGPVDTTFGNPLGGRQSWNGDSGGYIDTIVEMPAVALGASIQLRWRLATDNIPTSGAGWRIDSIEMIDDDVLRFDRGDAPDPTFPTLEGSDGAGHLFGSLKLGATVDVDADGQPNATATGDDTDGSDDENGVTLPASLTAGVRATVSVNASADGLLNAWVDFNGDGQWQSSEQIFKDHVVIAGNQDLPFDVPADSVVTTANARFRFSEQSALAPHGEAPNGEVEDYQVTIVAQSPEVASVVINDGDEQRSSVKKVEVTFDRLVVIDDTVTQPFQFLNTTTAVGALGLATTANVDGKTVVTFAFEPGPSITSAGSLSDGAYQLTIVASLITSGGLELDGDGDGTAGDSHVFGDEAVDQFFRKFGDATGNGFVNLSDFARFRAAFGNQFGDANYDDALDVDGNRAVNLVDFAAFRGNFGT